MRRLLAVLPLLVGCAFALPRIPILTMRPDPAAVARCQRERTAQGWLMPTGLVASGLGGLLGSAAPVLYPTTDPANADPRLALQVTGYGLLGAGVVLGAVAQAEAGAFTAGGCGALLAAP